MKRIIIEYDDACLSIVEALRRVLAIALRGYESKGRRGIDHFCWHSVFSDNSFVSIREKKHAGAADSFVVGVETMPHTLRDAASDPGEWGTR